MDDILVSPNIEFDIQIIDGQKQLIIDGAIIGTEEEILQHLKKSEGYDELVAMIHDEELFLKEDGVSEWTPTNTN